MEKIFMLFLNWACLLVKNRHTVMIVRCLRTGEGLVLCHCTMREEAEVIIRVRGK